MVTFCPYYQRERDINTGIWPGGFAYLWEALINISHSLASLLHCSSTEVMVGSSPFLVLALCVACIFVQLFGLAQAQNQTDPAEGVPLYLSLSHTQTQTHTVCYIYYSSWLSALLSSAYDIHMNSNTKLHFFLVIK